MKKNYFKLAMMAVFMLSVSIVSAQSALDGSTTNTNQAAATGQTVKLIDNKGTIKYIQSNNGITSITNTTDDLTTTTFQLGGTLVDNTNIATGVNEFKITVDTGGSFVINGIVEDTEGAATVMGGAGFSLLVRDESDGTVKNILSTDLIDVVLVDHPIGTNSNADVTITVTGVVALSTSINRISVYRNGIKLRENTDYSLGDDQVIVDVLEIGGTAYNGDLFEVQWIK